MFGRYCVVTPSCRAHRPGGEMRFQPPEGLKQEESPDAISTLLYLHPEE